MVKRNGLARAPDSLVSSEGTEARTARPTENRNKWANDQDLHRRRAKCGRQAKARGRSDYI